MTIKKISHTKACPVSLEMIDKHLIKMYSSIVLAVLIFTLLTPYKFALYAISVDFFIRVFVGIKYSPLCKLLTYTLQITAIKPILVDSGRKKIAAQVGLLFSIIISTCCFLHFHVLEQIFIGLFITAILLDLLFDYCLACKMQSLYNKYFKK